MHHHHCHNHASYRDIWDNLFLTTKISENWKVCYSFPQAKIYFHSSKPFNVSTYFLKNSCQFRKIGYKENF